MFREPNDMEYETLVAENRFINDVLLQIGRALDASEYKQADLARALKISEARVSQILAGNGKNLQARTIARIAHALRMRPEIEFVPVVESLADSMQEPRVTTLEDFLNAISKNPNSVSLPAWELVGPCNDDEPLESIAA